jgi:hypothetical protein
MTKFNLETFDWKNFNYETTILKSIAEFNIDFKKYNKKINKHIFSSPKTKAIILPLIEDSASNYNCIKELYDISDSIKEINNDKYSIKKKKDSQDHLKSILKHISALRTLFTKKDFAEINNQILGIDHETYQSFSDSNYFQSWNTVENFIFRTLEASKIKKENKKYAKNIVYGIQSHLQKSLIDYSLEEIDKHLASIESRSKSLLGKINLKNSRMHSLTISNKLPETFRESPSHGAMNLRYPKKLNAKMANITFFISNLQPFLMKNTSNADILYLLSHLFKNDEFFSELETTEKLALIRKVIKK